MGIESTDNAAQPKTTGQTAKPTGQAAPKVTSQPWSFSSQGMFGAPISRGVGSELYGKIKKALVEIYSQCNENVEMSVLDLDNINEPALNFSAILVATRFKNQKQNNVAYHILLLEGTGEKISPVYDNINGNQIEIYRVASDAINDVLVRLANEKMVRAFPTSTILFTDGTVVPATFNPDDKFALHRLALNAGLANGTVLETSDTNFQDMNLAIMPKDSSLVVNVGFNPQQIDDAVGNPMRSDFLLNFASKKNTNNNNRAAILNSGDQEVKVSEISGFVDVVWAPVAPTNVFNPYMQMQNMATQKYAARLIITNLASNYAYTPSSLLLALATSMALKDDSNWIQAFRPTASNGNEIDIRDIGALNIEANLSNEPSGVGTRIDTKADAFKLEELGHYVAALIQPGLIISLDCPDYGPQAWYMSVFSQAARGSQKAYNVIYDAANTLTAGNFAKYFPRNAAMFNDIGNRIHNGTWVDNKGNRRDIRDIDHIAVCNLVGDRNPKVIRDFSDTYLKTNYSLYQRLAARKKMISALTNETAKFTGFSDRVTPTAHFLDSLNKGIQETGINIRINTPLSGSDFNDQRGVASFASTSLMTPGQSFMSTGGYSQPNFIQTGTSGGFRY